MLFLLFVAKKQVKIWYVAAVRELSTRFYRTLQQEETPGIWYLVYSTRACERGRKNGEKKNAGDAILLKARVS